MAASSAFGDLEHRGWGTATVALAYHRNLGEVTLGCIPELIRAAELRSGDRVLDVACGVGYVAAAARDHGADVVGLDFSAVQIRLAQQTYPGIRFVEGNAEALPFADSEFDAVLNAFGLPHLPDPDKALAEACRTLKPAGRFAYASWCDATKCIGFSMVYDAIHAHGSLDVGLPPGPNFFSYGEAGFAAQLLARAGFVKISTTEVPLVWRVSSPDAIIDAISSGTVRAAAVLRRQRPENLARIKEYLRERVSAYERNGIYAVPSPALVASGTKPG